MSPKVVTPTIEQTLALQAERLRHLEALEIKLPVFDIRAWGAIGDNVTNNYPVIQGAINRARDHGGGIVYVPPLGTGAMDRYRIDETLFLAPGVSLLGAHALYSRISAHDAFPILDYAGAEPQGFFVKNLTLGFEGHYDNVNARCVDFSAPSPHQFIIENVVLRNGYYGYYDIGTSFLAGLKNVHIYQCKNGLYKTNGGAITLDQVYVQGTVNAAWDRQAMYFGAASVPVFINCFVESYHGNAHILHFVWCPSLIIDGLGMDANEDAAPGFRMLRFENCGQVDIKGLVNYGAIWPTGGAETDFIRFSDSKAHLSACDLSSVTFTGAGGTGNTLGMVDSFVTIAASYIPTPTSGVGAPAVWAIDMRNAATRLSLDCTTIGAVSNVAGGSYFEHHAGDGPL